MQALALSDVNLTDTEQWIDLLGDLRIDNRSQLVELQPYQSVWLSNAPGYGLVPAAG